MMLWREEGEEFNEVRDNGVSTGSLRSPDQTQTALFFSDVGVNPYQAALRDLVTRQGLDISDGAHLFGAGAAERERPERGRNRRGGRSRARDRAHGDTA